MRGFISALLLTLMAVVFIHLPSTITAQSQDGLTDSRSGLTVSPAIFEMIVEPGQVQERDFYVTNIKDRPVPLMATIKRLTPVEEEIDPSLSESFNAASWIEISEPNHILSGKERRRLTAKVMVPADAEPGGHYATVVLEPLVPAAPTGDSAAKVAAQVGIIVFITVKGEAVAEAAFSGGPQITRFHTGREVPIGAAVANTGTIHVLPTSSVKVRNLFGRVKADLPMKPRVVLPNTVKEFSTAWKDPAILGIYSVEVEGTYGSDQSTINSGKKYILTVRWLSLSLVLSTLLAIAIFTLKTYKRWPAAYRAFRGKLPGQRRIEEEDLLDTEH